MESSTRETIVSIALVAVTVPRILISLFARRLFSQSEIAFKEDIRRSFTRGLSTLPLATIKRYLKQPPIDLLLNSPRFVTSKNQLCVSVSTDRIRGAPDTTTGKPTLKKRELTLLWLHGGAYAFGHALSNTSTLLRVSEIVSSSPSTDCTLNIFSLEYTLAPDGKFPTQQREAVAAYRYLLSLGIDPESIIVAGESAGGHLAISCLLAIATEEAGLPKTHAALLLYPWVNLRNESVSFVENRHKDSLNKELLDRCRGAVEGVEEATQELGLRDFTHRAPHGRSWKDVLPPKTSVNVGSHDVFLHDIQAFVASAEADGADIELQVTPGMGHGWQLGLDRATEKEYVSLRPEEDVPKGIMRGSESVAEGLLKLLL